QKLEIYTNEKWDITDSMDKMKSTIIEDFREEKRFSPFPVFDDRQVISGINAVVEGSNEPHGILGIYSEEKRSFTGHDKSFLLVVANIFAEMIDRNKAERELSVAHQDLQDQYNHSRKLQQEILDINMSERWDLGSFLHDKLGQKLIAVKMMADSINRSHKKEDVTDDLKRMREILDESIEEIRVLAHNIIPIDIDTGIEHAFNQLIVHSQKLYNIECELDYNEDFTKINDRKLATNLYLIAQEAIKNAVLHGSANHIKDTAYAGDELVIKVQDNGSGMRQDEQDKSDGSGTHIMQHRVDILKGSLQIENNSDGAYNGAAVTCKIPL